MRGMPLNDLNLEFEDEEEKPKAPAAFPTPDLEFKQPDSPMPKQVTRPSIVPSPEMAQPVQLQTVGSSALKIQPTHQSDNAELLALRAEMQNIQIESKIKLGVAEFKVEIMSALLSDIKLMEHQIGQLLTRIHAKNPELKPEALMIKKILADFAAKKRK